MTGLLRVKSKVEGTILGEKKMTQTWPVSLPVLFIKIQMTAQSSVACANEWNSAK